MNVDEQKSGEQPADGSHTVTPSHAGEADDYKMASQSAADFAATTPHAHNFQAPYKPHHGKKPLVIGLVIVVIVAAGFGAWWQFMRQKPATDNTAQTNNTQSNSPESTPQSKVKITQATKEFSSTLFNLNFNYPEDWTPTEANNQITVRSPRLQLPDADGTETNAQIVLAINQKGQNLTLFDAGPAVAVRESQKVAYTKPTSTQRANTYLSFLRYAKTSGAGALDGVYVTGDIGYQKDQEAPKIDLAKSDPLISVTFVKCADQTCAAAQPLSVAASLWQDGNFSQPVTKMLTSLAVN